MLIGTGECHPKRFLLQCIDSANILDYLNEGAGSFSLKSLNKAAWMIFLNRMLFERLRDR